MGSNLKQHDQMRFLQNINFLQSARDHGYIVVTPEGRGETRTGNSWYGVQEVTPEATLERFRRDIPNFTEDRAGGKLGEDDVMHVLSLMLRENSKFRVDPDRVYLIGHSMGGAGAYYLAHKYK